MNINEDIIDGLFIQSYDQNGIQIEDKTYSNNIVVNCKGSISKWNLNDFAKISPKHCESLLLGQPEVVIIGTGEKHLLPDLSIIHYFAENNIGVEVMSTQAACRTYNILASEGRKIAAGFIFQ